MNNKFGALSVAGWVSAVGLVVFAVTGANPASLAESMRSPRHAEAASNHHFDDAKAGQLAAAAAADYLGATIGTPHSNTDGSTSDAVVAGGAPLSFRAMTQVDFRFVAKTREMVTSITSGVSFEVEKNFWIASWERPEVYNVTTGKSDGTAYVVVVIEDGTGKLLTASAGVRQPVEQAKARGPLPAYAELFQQSRPITPPTR